MTRAAALACLLLVGCDGTLGAPTDPSPDAVAMGTDGGVTLGVDADTPMPDDAGPAPLEDAGAPVPDAGPPGNGLAPDDLVPGAVLAVDGDNTVDLDGHTVYVRVDVPPREHVGLFYWFSPSSADVVMHVDRYQEGDLAELGYTDGGRGIRTLALFEGTREARTYYVRLEAPVPVSGTLEVVRTPFDDGLVCDDDCDALLQLPLRIDPAVDGYVWNASMIMRYQFGRRDLIMLFRHAAAELAAAGYGPITAGDFSQWDGATPGVDTGALRHASHQRGKDVDITLYGTDGVSRWRSYCETRYDSDPTGGTGRECVPGTVADFDAYANAVFFGRMFVSSRVTISFLDRELRSDVYAGAIDAIGEGELDPSLGDALSSGGVLSHWPNHDNHIHVRVSEAAYDGPSTLSVDLSPP